MKSHRILSLLACGLIIQLLSGTVVRGDKPASDDAKKEAVYRMYAGYKEEFPKVMDISARQAMALQDRGEAVFVDTRKPAEMAVSTLPDAVSQQDFLNHRDRYTGKSVITYCTISYRSGVFARDLAAQGITVINLQGGILAWILEGGTVYDAHGQPIRRVHVYGEKWNYAAEGYESVTFSLWEQMF